MKVVVPNHWQEGMLLLIIGLFGYAAQVRAGEVNMLRMLRLCSQITLVMGLQRETASRGMLAMYIQVTHSTSYICHASTD